MGLEPAADGDPGGRGPGVLQPVGGGPRGGVLGEQQLDGVPVGQPGGQGGEAPVDPGADTAVGRLAVLRVGGVDTAGPGGQADRAGGASVGAEHGDLPVLRQLGAQHAPEGVRVGRGLLPVEEARQPAGTGRVDPLLVAVCGGGRGAGFRRRGGLRRGVGVRIAEGDHAGFGDPVHLAGADDDFGDVPRGRGDGGVQRLVEVELRGGDEVLELRDDRGEAGVQLAQHGVAVGVLADEHEDAAEVGAAQLAAPPGDPVHGDEVPGPDLYLGGDAGVAQDGLDGVGDGGQRVALPRVGRDERAGVLVLLGVQDREDEVFQLGLEGLDAEPFGERDEDVAGDLGDARLFLGAHHAEGAHVVQPVGEFDGHDADVVAGGDEHLAEGLGFGGGAVVDLLDLGDAVDDEADLVAEFGADLIEGHLGVLDGVVQQRGRQSGGLGAEFGEDQRDGERMCDVRLTAFAHLAAVRGLREHVRAAQEGQVRVRVVGAVRLGDVADGVGEPVSGRGPEKGSAPESSQVKAGPAPSAEFGARFGSCFGVRGLCTHGHLRRLRPAVAGMG